MTHLTYKMERSKIRCISRLERSNPQAVLPIRVLVNIFTSDLILIDRNCRGVGVFYDANPVILDVGPIVTFSLNNFSALLENAKYHDLFPPLIMNDDHLDLLFGEKEAPVATWQFLAKVYAQQEIFSKGPRGKLIKSRSVVPQKSKK